MYPVTTRRRQSTLLVLFIFLQALLTVDAMSSSTSATVSGLPSRGHSRLTGTRSSPSVTRPAAVSYLQPTTAQHARSQPAESELYNITLDYVGSTNAALSWHRPLNGTIGNFFVVEWTEGNSNSSNRAKAGQSTRYELQQLHPNTNYTVTVYMDRNGNRSVYTVDFHFQTETAEKPSIIVVDVSNSSITVNVSGTTDNINLTCSPQCGIASYTNINSAYVFDNLLAGNKYNYTIELQTVRHFKTAQRTIYTRPNVPGLITIVNISSNLIHLKWRLQTGGVMPTVILQYHLHSSELYYEHRSPQENVIIGGVDKSFLPGHTYSISIFALLVGLESDHAHLVVTTRPLTPIWKKPEIYDSDGKMVLLSWTTNESSYQDSFNISFTDYNDNNVRTVTVEDDRLSTEIDNLVPGAKYEFSICACSRNSCSEYTQLSHVMKPLKPSVSVDPVDERSALLVFRSQSQPQYFSYYSVLVLPTGLAKRSQVNITSTNHSADFVYNLTGLFPGQYYTINISTVTVDGVTSEDYEVVAFTTIPVIDINVTQSILASTSDSVTIQYSIGSRSSDCDNYIFTLKYTSLSRWVDCQPNTGTVKFEGLAPASEHILNYEAKSARQRSRKEQLKVYTAPAQPTGLICDTSNNTLTVCIPRQSTNVDHYTIKLYNLNSTGSDTEPINTSCNTVLYNVTNQECEIESDRTAPLLSENILRTDDNRCFLCNNSTYHDGDSNECSGENGLVVNEKCSSKQTGNVGIKVCDSSGDACNAMMKCDQRGVDGCYSVMMCNFKDDGVGYENCTSVFVVNKVSETTTTMPFEEQCKNATKLVFDHLDAITTYRFDVTAVWRGLHSSTETLSCVTRETLPGPVMDLRVTKLEPNLVLSWNEPKSKSGRLLRYNIALFLIQDELLEPVWSNTTEATYNSFDNLAADKTYVVEVAAVTSVGTGPNTSLNVTLPIKAPFVKNMSAVTAVRHLDHDHFIVLLVNPFTDVNGQVVSYSVVIAQNSSRRSHNGHVENCPSGFYCRIIVNKCPTLFAEGFDHFDHCWKSDIPERSPGSTKLLQVGKEENCMERTYCNYKLEPSTVYFLFIRGYNRLNQFDDSALSQPITTNQIPIPQLSDPTSVILITVVILLVITAAAIIIFLYFRWHNPPLKALNRYARQNTIWMAALPSLSSKPIGAYDFVEHVSSLEKDSGLLFSDEFEELKFVGRDQSCEEAELQCNRAKNRFTNILPYDNTRVKLLPVEDVEGSDYINANWIPGFISKREFIATQGPLPSTKDDFWRLIWEYNCRAVIMLTLCMENGRIKCDQYWPMDAEPVFYGDLEIKIMNETITSSWHIREMQISLGEQSRRIKHFHYLEWPDMKVPDQLSMLAFVHQVRSYVNSKVGGPIVVHCSAGVGRSGTFIALDVLLQQLEHDDVVDVYGVVCRMRLGRVLMVQTEQQYIFVYECMKHVLLEQLVKPTILHDSSPVYENSCVSNEPNNDTGSEASETSEASEASEASKANEEKNTESDNAEDEGIDDNTVSC